LKIYQEFGFIYLFIFFAIFFCSHTGVHAQEELSQIWLQVKKESRNSLLYFGYLLEPICLNMAISESFYLRNLALLTQFFFTKDPLHELH